MRIYLHIILAIIFQATTAYSSNIQTESKLSDKINEVVSSYQKNHFLNAVYQINEGENVIAKGASGLFSKEQNQNLEANQQMLVASITKSITAASILKLQEKGLLNVQNSIAEYLSENSGVWESDKIPSNLSKDSKLPDWAHTVTIHNLLTHTSGLAEYFMATPLHVENGLNAVTKDILNFAAQQPLQFKPGEDYKYTNTNYVILGLIIEKVSGQDLKTFFKQEIFDPIEMKSSRLIDLSEALEGQLNPSKSGCPIRYFITPTESDPIWTAAKPDYLMIPYADGGVLSSAEDLIKWNQALHNGKVLSPKSYDLMITKYYKAPGKFSPSNYTGYGIFVDELENGDVVYYHSGSALAIRAEAGYIPSKNVYFAVLSNVMNYIPDNMKDKINLEDPKNQLDIFFFVRAIFSAI